MADQYAAKDDVIAVFGPLTPEQGAVIEGLLLQASLAARVLARTACVDIDELRAEDELFEEALRAAVVNAVVRVLRNPKGLRQYQQSSTSGPFTDSEGGTFDTTIAAGALYVDPADLAPWITAPTTAGFVGTARLRAGLG